MVQRIRGCTDIRINEIDKPELQLRVLGPQAVQQPGQAYGLCHHPHAPQRGFRLGQLLAQPGAGRLLSDAAAMMDMPGLKPHHHLGSPTLALSAAQRFITVT